MKKLTIIIICMGLSISTWSLPRWANTPPADTVSAQVIYGNDDIFDELASKSGVALSLYLDSLERAPNVPKTYLNQIAFYTQIKNKNYDDLYTVIDSLFELEKIPYSLINQVNLLISNPPSSAEGHENLRKITCNKYPADNLYPTWITSKTQPYNYTIYTAEDSAFYVDLLPNNQHFSMPINDVLTSKFGWRNGRPHNGIDIDLQVWDTVVAAFNGVIRVARTCGGYGRTVIIRHDNGLETTYAHLHRIKVKSGQKVTAGQLIGLGGSSGNSTGSHLHFEVRYKGKAINPLNFIDYSSQSLMSNVLYIRKTKNGFTAYPYGSEFYTVKQGDYLYKIAAHHGVTVQQLCKLNGISRNSPLRVGQKLRII